MAPRKPEHEKQINALTRSVDRLRAANEEHANEKKRLSRALAQAEERAEAAEARLGFVQKVTEAQPKVPTWRVPKRRKKAHHGIPTLMLSDLHFGEVVDPNEVQWSNAYSVALAERRLEHTIESAIKLTRAYWTGVEYDGFVLALGGDILGGSIHLELAKTNEQTDFEAVVHWVPRLAAAIQLVADEFGKVYVPCVTGNHDRSPANRRTPSKQRAQDSFTWIVYHWLKQHFEGDDRVTIEVATSADLRYDVYDTRYLLTHGDQFRGGNGIGGIATPLMRGVHKKQQREATLGRPFDYMIIGHWHQQLWLQNLIVNGSMKGYDEFAYTNNFAVERPQQALWLTTPENGITMRCDVFCDPDDEPWKQ